MGKIYVTYGKAISPEEARQMNKQEYVANVNQQIIDMQTELRSRYHLRA
jgi:hypothetical protein